MPAFDVDGFLDDYKGKVVKVTVCNRGDLLAEHADLEATILARGPSDTLHDRDLEDIRNQIRAIETQMDESSREFTFGALGARAWQDLIRKHPPTKDQAAKTRGLDHNPDTFPQAAIAACAVAPELTDEQAGRLAEVLPLGEWTKLWTAVYEANLGEVNTPKSMAAGLIDAALASAASSTTAAPEGSPAASS